NRRGQVQRRLGVPTAAPPTRHQPVERSDPTQHPRRIRWLGTLPSAAVRRRQPQGVAPPETQHPRPTPHPLTQPIKPPPTTSTAAVTPAPLAPTGGRLPRASPAGGTTPLACTNTATRQAPTAREHAVSQPLLLTGAQLVDGTGAPPRPADVLIENGDITAVEPPGTLPTSLPT